LKERAKRKNLDAKHDVWTEIRYLEKHGQEGHLRYVMFRRRGIPCPDYSRACSGIRKNPFVHNDLGRNSYEFRYRSVRRTPPVCE